MKVPLATACEFMTENMLISIDGTTYLPTMVALNKAIAIPEPAAIALVALATLLVRRR